MRRRQHQRGLTLIETLVVVGIIGMLIGMVAVSARSIAKTELRGSAAKLAAGMRYCFNRSITTGAYFRIVLDLDGNKYWAERSDERFYLSRDKEFSKNGRAPDLEALERKKREDEAREEKQRLGSSPLAQYLEPPPKPKRAKFQTFADAAMPAVQLKKVKLYDVFTPRQQTPYEKGRAYIYFFPDGHTERAMIHLRDGDDYYTLIVAPLTGRVDIQSGLQPLPRDFGDRDDEGKEIKR